jgi:hypothetical protein
VDRLKGADSTSLENKIQQYYGTEDAEDCDSSVRGHVSCFEHALLYMYIILKYVHIIWCLDFLQMDLSTFIHKQQCECLNESDDHPFVHCLTSSDGYLESDCDEQVLFILQVM